MKLKIFMFFIILIFLFLNVLKSNEIKLDCNFNQKNTIDYLHELYIYIPGNIGDKCVNTYSYTNYLKDKKTVKTQNQAVWKKINDNCLCKDTLQKVATWDKEFKTNGKLSYTNSMSNKVKKKKKIINKETNFLNIVEKEDKNEENFNKEVYKRNKLVILEKEDIKYIEKRKNNNNEIVNDMGIEKDIIVKNIKSNIENLEEKVKEQEKKITSDDKTITKNYFPNHLKTDSEENGKDVDIIDNFKDGNNEKTITKNYPLNQISTRKDNEIKSTTEILSEENLFAIENKKEIENHHKKLFKNTNYGNIFNNKKQNYKKKLYIEKKDIRKKAAKNTNNDKVIISNRKYILKKYLKKGKYKLKLLFSKDVDVIKIYNENMRELYNIPIFNKNKNKISFTIYINHTDYYTFAALNGTGKGRKSGLQVISMKKLN